MRNWDTRDERASDTGCEWEKDWHDVQRVCKLLDIPCKMVDLSKEYWNRVFQPSLDVWHDGDTPNPDVWCNREIKFGALFNAVDVGEQGWFATGHYARKSWHDSKPKLLSSTDTEKDQTFYLSSITMESLARSIFPVGDFSKESVRDIACLTSREFGGANLFGEGREESMGLCFVGERGKFSGFLSSYLPPEPGPIVDMEMGKQIGKHQGLWTYTIGQGARIPGMKQKMFVASKDKKSNTVFVVPGIEHPLLSPSIFHVRQMHWIWGDPPDALVEPNGRMKAYVKLRHRMAKVLCLIQRSGDSFKITMEQAQHGIAPGQVAVIWDGDEESWCLGCGTIYDPMRH